MTITREQVADLREGDVVELGFDSGSIVRGPLVEDRHTGSLLIADAGWIVRDREGDMGYGLERYAETLTVVSRAPRPLYVNHPRTSPVPGDVVRAEDSDDPMRVWLTSSNEDGDVWWVDYSAEWVDRGDLPDRLRLLVDGETGQVVQ